MSIGIKEDPTKAWIRKWYLSNGISSDKLDSCALVVQHYICNRNPAPQVLIISIQPCPRYALRDVGLLARQALSTRGGLTRSLHAGR